MCSARMRPIATCHVVRVSVCRCIGHKGELCNKLAPYGTDGRLLLTENFKVTWHKNYDKIQKTGPNLRIRAHLPAPIINGGGDSLWKWPNFRLARARDLDLGSGHTAYRHASLVDLYLHTNFIEIEETLWTDGRTDILRPTLLGQLDSEEST